LLGKKPLKFFVAFDLALHPRCWAQLIHEFICRQRIGSFSGKEIKDGVIGVSKACPGFEFLAACLHAIMDGEFESWLVAGC
jgi:hypothetical protein